MICCLQEKGYNYRLSCKVNQVRLRKKNVVFLPFEGSRVYENTESISVSIGRRMDEWEEGRRGGWGLGHRQHV